jgi:hypothetical protein
MVSLRSSIFALREELYDAVRDLSPADHSARLKDADPELARRLPSIQRPGIAPMPPPDGWRLERPELSAKALQG